MSEQAIEVLRTECLVPNQCFYSRLLLHTVLNIVHVVNNTKIFCIEHRTLTN